MQTMQCNVLSSFSMGHATEWTSFRILKDEVEVRLFVKPSMSAVANNRLVCPFPLADRGYRDLDNPQSPALGSCPRPLPLA